MLLDNVLNVLGCNYVVKEDRAPLELGTLIMEQHLTVADAKDSTL